MRDGQELSLLHAHPSLNWRDLDDKKVPFYFMTKQQEKRFSVINHPFMRIFILIDDFIIIYHCHT